MTNKEMLEFAAKAAGFANFDYACPESGICVELGRRRGAITTYWNPLNDEGDALRLAVKLGLQVFTDYKSGIDLQPGTGVLIGPELPPEFWLAHNDDPYAATRRAIVRAAAEIGKRMK
jgi:hypothetical protein